MVDARLLSSSSSAESWWNLLLSLQVRSHAYVRRRRDVTATCCRNLELGEIIV